MLAWSLFNDSAALRCPALPLTRHCDLPQNNFERNQRDVFRFRAADVGELQRLVIRHDNTGISPDWHLQQVSEGKTASSADSP